MAKDLYHIVDNCRPCIQTQVYEKILRNNNLVLPDESLKYICTDDLGPLPNTKQANQLVLPMIDT